jgi:HSP20 family molecular chaperone IbpA
MTDRASAPATSAQVVHGALGCPSVDELAQQDICAALLATPGLDARHIEVEMSGPGVLLRGTVARPGDREWALRVARRIAAPRPVRETLTLPSSCETDAPPHRTPRVPEATDAE